MANVLIVEDDADTRDLLSRYLRMVGHSTTLAANGQEALVALNQQQPDLVVLDMMLPVMDGPAFLRAVNARQQAAPPVLVCSALDRDQITRAVGTHSACEVLQKNDGFFIDLVEAVAHWLRPQAPAQ